MKIEVDKFKIKGVFNYDEYNKIRKERKEDLSNLLGGALGALLDIGVISLINNNVYNDVLKIIGIAIFGTRCLNNGVGGFLYGLKAIVDNARMKKITTVAKIK